MKTKKFISHRLGVMAAVSRAGFELGNNASFYETIRSFCALTDAERAQAKTYSLRPITAQPGAAFAQLVKPMPQLGRDAGQRLPLMNGKYSNGN